MSVDIKPAKLSAESRERWDTLTSAYTFTTAEQVALTEHLLAKERAAKYEHDGKLELAQKERMAAARWWRVLKFDAGDWKRPGRPSETAWSAQRRAGRAS